MSAEFKYNVVFICPEIIKDKANQLACIIGSTIADINTFNLINYEDADLNKYSVIGTVARQDFIDRQQSGVPETLPPWAQGCNREEAVEVFNNINQVGGLQFFVNVPIQDCIDSMGLVKIEESFGE